MVFWKWLKINQSLINIFTYRIFICIIFRGLLPSCSWLLVYNDLHERTSFKSPDVNRSYRFTCRTVLIIKKGQFCLHNLVWKLCIISMMLWWVCIWHKAKTSIYSHVRCIKGMGRQCDCWVLLSHTSNTRMCIFMSLYNRLSVTTCTHINK